MWRSRSRHSADVANAFYRRLLCARPASLFDQREHSLLLCGVGVRRTVSVGSLLHTAMVPCACSVFLLYRRPEKVR